MFARCSIPAIVAKTSHHPLSRVGATGTRRCLLATTAAPSTCSRATDNEDPAAHVWEGTVKLWDLSVKDLKTSLDFRNIKYDGCFDKESLQNKLAVHMMQADEEAKVDEDQNEEQQQQREPSGNTTDEPRQAGNEEEASETNLLEYIPRTGFALSPKLTGYDKELVYLVPLWSLDVVNEMLDGNNYSDEEKRHISFGARRRIQQHFERERGGTLDDDDTDEAIHNVLQKALILHVLGSSHADEVSRITAVDLQTAPEKYHPYPVVVHSPVPKGWEHTFPKDTPPELQKKCLEAIEYARENFKEGKSTLPSLQKMS